MERCSFHDDREQKIEYYFSLKNAIDEVVRNGELKNFILQKASPLG